MFKSYLFDLDGVIFNTEPQYTRFWGEVGRTYFSEDPDFAKRIKGQTLVEILHRYFGGELSGEQEHVIKKLNEFEAQMSFDFVPGFPEFISYLKHSNVRRAVVTSSNQQKMSLVYRQHPEFSSMFDEILTAEDFDKSKPDPDCYLKAAAKFGLPPSLCVGFEDSVNGLKAVRNADMHVVGLATTNPESLIRPLSDMVITDFTDDKVRAIV